MATIKAFKGIRYNEAAVGNLSEVIAPPYDVIGPAEQQSYYRRSPYNIVRLEYGLTLPEDTLRDNRYTRAAATLRRWLDQGILKLEVEKAFYLYRQTFTHDGIIYRRHGLVTALQVEPYENKIILPHEETLQKPKSDRLELLRHCRANFSPIFGLFPDPAGEVAAALAAVQEEAPLCRISEPEGQQHTLWAIQDAALQETLTRLLAPQRIIIADGHHRYETALTFSREFNPDGRPGYSCVLAVLVSLQDPGLVILPTHRLLEKLTPGQEEILEQNLARYFQPMDCGHPARLSLDEFRREIEKRGRKAPAMGLLQRGRARLLVWKGEAAGEKLDVSILQKYLLDPLFERSDRSEAERHLTFTRDAAEAREAVCSGRAGAAFILNPTPMEEVTARAARGEKMPQKSTYFYPKLPSGLVIHHLELSHNGH